MNFLYDEMHKAGWTYLPVIPIDTKVHHVIVAFFDQTDSREIIDEKCKIVVEIVNNSANNHVGFYYLKVFDRTDTRDYVMVGLVL